MFVLADQLEDLHAAAIISMPGLSPLAGSTPVCANLPAVMHASSRDREEQVQCSALYNGYIFNT